MSKDTIYRQAAIDALENIGSLDTEADRKYARRVFEALPSAQTDLITKIQNAIKATDADNAYSCGMRNCMRWCISLIDGKEPVYENCPPEQPEERQKGRWVEKEKFGIEHIQCDQCGHWFLGERLIRRSFCPNCGADMRGKDDG